MTIKHKHINTNGDTEYTVEHRPSLQCCEAYKNEHGDLELTMHLSLIHISEPTRPY